MDPQTTRQSIPPQGSLPPEELLRKLSPYLTPERRQRIESVLSLRTRKLTVVLEDVRQGHNVSAVLRSCDAFGVQDVHVIQTTLAFEASARVALGSQQWLSINRYEGTTGLAEGLAELKARNYRLVATVPPDEATLTLEELPLDEPVALVFGREKSGLSERLKAAAEERVSIPMVGFVESLNLSVAAAIILQSLTSRLRRQSSDWGLTRDEQADLRLAWTRNSVRAANEMERLWAKADQTAATTASEQ